MEGQLTEKSLKLLADPNKFKGSAAPTTFDPFKFHLECKFRCKLDHSLYANIVATIQHEITIYSVMNDIIYQVIEGQNLTPNPYS
jgi:hypothetical protein